MTILIISSGITGAIPAFALDFQNIRTFTSRGSETLSADINNDGFDDLVHIQSSSIEVRLGPDLTFFKSITLSTSSPPSNLNGNHIAVGDINGDGFDDIITSFARDNSSGEGQMQVYFGPSLTSVTTKLNPEPRASIGSGTHFGIAVAAGDINGDGFDDVVVGAKKSPSATDRDGAAFVYMGPSLSGPTKILNPPSPDPFFDNFGTQVEIVDGFVMVSDPISKVTTNNRPMGEVHVFSSTLSFVKTLTSGSSSTEVFGDRLTKGDVNNDGNEDLIVKGWFNDVFIFTGPTFSSPIQLIDPNPGVGFGTGLATGDLDNDGDDDLLVGSPGSENVYVYEAPSLFLSETITETGPNAFGSSVAVGDIDGDGRGDLLLAGGGFGFHFRSLPPDTGPPSINSLLVTPDPVPLPGVITINAGISDDLEVSSASAVIQGPSSSNTVGSVTLSLISGSVTSGTYSSGFTFPSESAAPDGSYQITVTATDVVGKTSSSATSITLARAAPPNANDDTATVLQNEQKAISVLSNDNDPNGDSLSVTSVSTPPHGTAVINADNTVTYTPDEDYVGADSFTYDVFDGGLTSTATVSITVENPTIIPISATGQITWFSSKFVTSTSESCNPFGGCTTIFHGEHRFSGTPFLTSDPNTIVDYLFRSSIPLLFNMGGTGVGTTYAFENTDATLQSLVLGNNVITPVGLGLSHFTADLSDAVDSALLATQPAPVFFSTTNIGALPNQPPQTAVLTVTDDWTISFVPALSDDDGDGVPNVSDNCPDDSNPGQEDHDNDMIGDVCDPNTEITTNTVATDTTFGGDLIVDGASFTIPSGITVNFDFENFKIIIKAPDGKILIEFGGKIT